MRKACIIVLFILCIVGVTYARKYVTDISCTEDSECNYGECVNGKCKCKDMYYPKEVDGILQPCYDAYGNIYPASTYAFGITFLILMLSLIITHITVTVSLSIKKKKPQSKRLLKSWQYDPRFTLINMCLACVVSMIWTGLWFRYAFGGTKNYIFSIVNDLAKVFYFEAGTAVVFYWFVAVTVAKGKSRTFVKFPYLALSFFVFMVWWCISSFVPFVAADFARYVNLILGLAILVFIVAGLAYYGKQVISMLSPENQSSDSIIRKISIFLYMAGATIFGDAVFIVVIASINEANSPSGYIGSLWCLMVLEIWIQIVFLVTFGGGSFKRIVRTLKWVCCGRSGSNPLEEAILLKDSHSHSQEGFSPNGSTHLSTFNQNTKEQEVPADNVSVLVTDSTDLTHSV